MEKRASLNTKEDFDIYTKGANSPSKKKDRFRASFDPSATNFSGKFS